MNFLKSVSFEVKIADEGNFHEDEWNLNEDLTSKTSFEGEEEKESSDSAQKFSWLEEKLSE